MVDEQKIMLRIQQFIYLFGIPFKEAGALDCCLGVGSYRTPKTADNVKRGLGEDREQVCESWLKFSSNFENTAVTQAKRNILFITFTPFRVTTLN